MIWSRVLAQIQRSSFHTSPLLITIHKPKRTYALLLYLMPALKSSPSPLQVDERSHVKGIVTRKDLLGYRLDEALSRAMGAHAASSHSRGRGRLARPTPAVV